MTKNTNKLIKHPTLALRLAPEDVVRGMYITPLWEFDEMINCLSPVDETTRKVVSGIWKNRPLDAGTPLLVECVCLPFVVVRKPKGGFETLDARRYEFAKLDRAFAEHSLACIRGGSKRSKKQREKKSRK